jgi:chromosome partitioning protein
VGVSYDPTQAHIGAQNDRNMVEGIQ